MEKSVQDNSDRIHDIEKGQIDTIKAATTELDESCRNLIIN